MEFSRRTSAGYVIRSFVAYGPYSSGPYYTGGKTGYDRHFLFLA